jgi:uncharacterized membrane protein YeaQ/YmgE (transglycosylase-associated protein family)
MPVFITICIGVLIGVVAALAIRKPSHAQFFVCGALGVIGASVTTMLGTMFGWYGHGQLAGYICATLGAGLLLLLYRLYAMRRNFDLQQKDSPIL